MSKKLLFKGGHATGMIPYEIEDFSTLYMMDARVDEKTKAYIDGVIGNSVLNLCPYRNVLVTHKYDTVEGNVVTLDDCQDDEVIQLSEIQGNTMVNCNKDTDKELILMPNLDTNGYSNITLTEGVDGGKVDVSLEGNTMVNVCDQEEPVAITKLYTVETGNHIALQGEYDGKCRPNVYGNTLVNILPKFSTSSKNYVGTNSYNVDEEGYATVNGVGDWRKPFCTTKTKNSFIKYDTIYTIICDVKENTLTRTNTNKNTVFDICSNNVAEAFIKSINGEYSYQIGETGRKIVTVQTKTESEITLNVDNVYFPRTQVYNIVDSGYIKYRLIVLEGDYTNKPIPDYFTGMKSSFEDKLVPENLINYNEVVCNYNEAKDYQPINTKANQIYTVVVNILENTCDKGVWFSAYEFIGQSTINDYYLGDVREGNIKLASQGQTGIFKLRIGYTQLGSKGTRFALFSEKSTSGSFKATAYVVEGDYTNYDFTDYDSTKAGKYKVDYKVTGKNKFNKDNSIINTVINIDNGSIITETKTEGQWYTSPTIDISNISNITISHKNDAYINSGTGIRYLLMDEDYNPKLYADCVYKNYAQTLDVSKYKYMKISVLTRIFPLNTIQLEEGTTATDYEQYKESIKTLYLNSPLLEGDTIEQSGNNIIHVHRYKEVVLDGSEDESWILHDNQPSDTSLIRFSIEMPSKKAGTFNIICDKMSIGSLDGNFENINTECISGHPVGVAINIWAKKGKLATQDLAGFKTWLQQNPITVAYELETPTQEVISTNDNLLLDSYVNGHLDVDTVIPIDKVEFRHKGFENKYLNPNTDYIVQFEADNPGKIDYILLGREHKLNINATKGINKILCTSGEIGNWLDIVGIGFNASKIVVTPKVEQPFGYFKGMKSVGECEGNKIEILSQNKNLYVDCFEFGDIQKSNGLNSPSALIYRTKDYIKVEPNTRYSFSRKFTSKWHALYFYDINKKYIRYNDTFGTKFVTPNNVYYVRYKFLLTDSSGDYIMQIEKGESITNYIKGKQNKKEILMNEPLRGLPNGVRDKYVIIDGKWYIERNTIQLRMDSQFIQNKKIFTYVSQNYPDVIGFSTPNNWFKWNSALLCDNFAYDGHRNISAGSLISNQEKIFVYDYIFITLNKNKVSTLNEAGVREYLKNNPIILVGQNTTPTYEPIDYNPFEVYTDITHISNNSIIPCNMVIKNTGYNCILKPNTKYTVSSSNGLSTVTTKDSIGDSVLRFYNKDTSKITKMNNVLVLEGDYVTGNPPIPAFFTGMESAFEQELVTDEKDEHYGKYKVNVKAVGKNLLDETKGVMNTGLNSKTICIKVRPNATYVYSSSVYKGTIVIYELPYEVNHGADIGEVKSIALKNYMIADGQSFTTVNSTNYILMNYDDTSNVQLEQGTKATAYEPYKENNITFYLNEPLRGVGNVKDKVYVKEDKVVVERNCSSVTFDGSDDEEWVYWSDNTNNGKLDSSLISFYLSFTNYISANNEILIINDRFIPSNTVWASNTEKIALNGDKIISFQIACLRSKLTTQDVAGFRQWLQNNPTTVVYQLATPTYEEVECDLSKLALEGYENGTLFYDTNIPVTTQFYDFDVNIKDMLIPNETYYVTFNADRVKDITINLSGVQVNYKTSMGYNKVPIQLGDVVNTNFSMDSRGVELSDIMVSTSTSLIYVKDMNDVCVYDEASNKYSITITSTNGKESDKRVILLDYPLLRLNKDIYDRLYYSNKDSRYRIDKKVFKHKFTNEHEYSKYAAETNDTYYSSFISLNEAIKDYVVITNEKVKTVKVEDDKYYFKIKWSDLGVSDKTEANGNQGVKDFFNNNEVYLYYATDGFVEIVDELRRQTLKVYQPETFMKFSGNTTTTVTILIPMKNV